MLKDEPQFSIFFLSHECFSYIFVYSTTHLTPGSNFILVNKEAEGRSVVKKKKKLSSLLLWNKPEGKALEWWVGFKVMTNVFSCPPYSAPQRGGWKGEEIWRS